MAWALACTRKIGSSSLAGALLIPYTCCQVVIVIERIDYNCNLHTHSKCNCKYESYISPSKYTAGCWCKLVSVYVCHVTPSHKPIEWLRNSLNLKHSVCAVCISISDSNTPTVI